MVRNKDLSVDDNIHDLARDSAYRLRWDMETGIAAYPSKIPSVVETGTAIKKEQLFVEGTSLEALRNEIGDCTRCELHNGRTNIVFGEGNESPSLVFTGEGPGHDEDLAGRPFVGAAGQLLDKIIAAMGLFRKDVYICNVVKCRPPGNRVPTEEEQAICGKFLQSQLAILQPKIVIALGVTSAKFLTHKDDPIGKLRGHFHNVGNFVVMPTYHPAYLLRNASAKRPVWEDMKLVMSMLEKSRQNEK